MSISKKITISPIFDQSAGSVWSDFMRIEILCNLKYGFSVDDSTKAYIYNRNKKEWEKEEYTFAFGAYEGKKMVGFASGYRENEQEMYLHNLYVTPEYKGQGIGTALLRQAERNATLVTDNMMVISLDGALGFYKQSGYSIYDDRNCEKKLSEDIIGVIPVFESVDWFRGVKINLDIDIAELKQFRNVPIFAYVSLGREIDGIAVMATPDKTRIWTNRNKIFMKDFYEKKLLKELAKVK